MALLSRSTLPPELDDQLEYLQDKPEALLDARRKQFIKLGKKIKEMTDTAGWKEVLLPFLERHGNTDRLLGKTFEEYQKVEPRVAAYKKLLFLVKNLLTLAEDEKEGPTS
jgi:hypothetical protein